MGEIKSFRDLVVWQKAIALVKEIYRLVKLLPKEELYALSDQMRRAVVSVPSNIAEGYGRNSKKDYGRFLSISLGSVYELQTQLIVCCELEFLRPDDVRSAMDLITEISKMLNALIRKVAC